MMPQGMRGHGGPCVLAGLYRHFRAQPMPYCGLPSLVFGVRGRSLVFMIPVSAFAEEGVKPKDVDRWLLTAHESQWVPLNRNGPFYADLRPGCCMWVLAGHVLWFFHGHCQMVRVGRAAAAVAGLLRHGAPPVGP